LELAIHNQAILARISSIEDSSPLQLAQNWFRYGMTPMIKPDVDLYYLTSELLVTQDVDRDELKKYVLTLLKKADFMISDIEITREETDSLKDPTHLKHNAMSNSAPYTATVKYDIGLVHQLDNGAFKLDLNDESMGTKRYYGLGAIMMMLVKYSLVIPIDEIESSLHNDLLYHFIATFLKNSQQGQLIFTSHNTSLLNERDIIRKDCIWITDRKADGSTELTSVSEYPVRKEHSLASLFKKGLIGGKPRLGSIDLGDLDG